MEALDFNLFEEIKSRNLISDRKEAQKYIKRLLLVVFSFGFFTGFTVLSSNLIRRINPITFFILIPLGFIFFLGLILYLIIKIQEKSLSFREGILLSLSEGVGFLYKFMKDKHDIDSLNESKKIFKRLKVKLAESSINENGFEGRQVYRAAIKNLSSFLSKKIIPQINDKLNKSKYNKIVSSLEDIFINLQKENFKGVRDSTKLKVETKIKKENKLWNNFNLLLNKYNSFKWAIYLNSIIFALIIGKGLTFLRLFNGWEDLTNTNILLVDATIMAVIIGIIAIKRNKKQ